MYIHFDLKSERGYIRQIDRRSCGRQYVAAAACRQSQQLIKNGATVAGVGVPGSSISDSLLSKGFLEHKSVERLSLCTARMS
jgi:hypothetical protein